jgi:hypothetical protein
MFIGQAPQREEGPDREDAERARRDLAMLDELGEIAMQIARRAGQRSLEETGTGDGGAQAQREAEVAFERAARTVRGIVTLKLRIATRAVRKSAPAAPARAAWSRTEQVRRLLRWAERMAPDAPDLPDIRRDFATELASRVDSAEVTHRAAGELIRRVLDALPEGVRERIVELEDAEVGVGSPGTGPP